jgi:tricorn protease
MVCLINKGTLMTAKAAFFFLALTLVLFNVEAMAKPGYFRSPALHDDTLVFTAEGDLWLADIKSGQTQRLTTHPAEEKGAAISPDGQWIAFTANYEGAKEVYVIPSSGGVAKRLSYENTRSVVQGWTPNDEVIYSTNSRMGAPGSWGLVTIDPESMKSQQLPLADAIEGAVDDKGEYVYFVRFGLQVSTDNVRAYRGGAQGKLWRYRLGSTEEATQLAIDHPGSIREPMIAGNQLYFISDASGTDNIWTIAGMGGNAKQVTDFINWEVRTAQLSSNKSQPQIVFQHGPDIKLLNLADDSIKTINLNLVSDFPNLREHWDNKPLKLATSANMAAKTDQVALTARGRVAIAGNRQLRLVEINSGSTSRTRAAILSGDGKWIYAINDSSGEHEIWRYAADGSDDAKQLTDDGEIFRWALYQSPDGKWLAHDDKAGRLFLLNLSNGKNKQIMDDNIGLDAFQNVVWSPDSQFLAITRNHVDDLRSRIQLYAVKSGQTGTLTSDKYESYSPAFSVDGDWLYFLSDRNFNASPGAPWGDRNTGSQFDRRTEVFAYALHDKARFPFQAAHELMTEKADKKAGDKDEKDDKAQAEQLNVQWPGLKDRLWQVPVASGNYSKMLLNDQFIYLQDLVRGPNSKPKIKSLKLEFEAKPKLFTNQVEDFQLSQDGKNMMVRKTGGDNANIFIVPAAEAFPEEAKEAQLVTQTWQMLLNPKLEWQQIFYDTWLMHRDSLFDANMRGLDWPEVRQKYSILLDRVTDRYELNDVLAQMTGELNTLHSQVGGGDVAKDVDSPKVATLGGHLVQDKGGVMIKHIYRHDAELPSSASPLALASVDARDGDVIVSVNGTNTPTLAALGRQLRNQAGKQVLLKLKRAEQIHQTIVTPVTNRDDVRLRYQHWVAGKKTEVEQNSDDIGYLHLYAMGARDFANFTREFYTLYNKPALIIDVRRNRGGNVDSLILEKLLRRNWMYWQAPRGQSSGNMQQTFGGHLVVLADQFTYSDGETFTAGVKAMGLGTVIGKQTAGAGVWLSGRNRVSDSGISRVAEYPVFDVNGNWVVEGHGVTPDIEVSNLPHATFMGEDAQLEAALKYLEQKLSDEPIKVFKAKDFPAVDQAAMDVKKIER